MKELIEKRNRLVAEIRSIVDQMEKSPSADLEEKLATLEKDCDQVDKLIEAETRQQERELRSKAQINNAVDPVIGQSQSSQKQEDEKALRAEAFSEFLKRGESIKYETRYNGLVANNMTEGGSFIAPQEFVAQVIKAIDDAVVIRSLATKFTLVKSGSLGFPTLDADLSDFEWTTELATGSVDTTLKTGKREFVPNPLAKRVKASRKFLAASAVPVEQFVAERLGYKVGITQEKAFMTGNGASQPLGLFTASANGISTSRDVSTDNTSSAITFDGLINALYSLKSGYQEKATWLFHRDAIKMLRKIKDGQQQYIWQPAVSAGLPATLLDRPIVQSENVPNTFTTGLYVGMVGDFSNYWIVDVLNLEVQRLNELYAEANQVGWIGRMECDAAPVLQEAFARVKLA